MAIVPNRSKPLKGFIGNWANMENANAVSMLAGSKFAAGVALSRGTADNECKPLVTGEKFIGIALATVNMDESDKTSDGYCKFREGDILGVADMGSVFVTAGDGAEAGVPVFYEPETRKFHGTSKTGLLPLTGCTFGESAEDGEVVQLRIRLDLASEPVVAVV